jgi:L-fuconolactonase
MTVIDAHQHFWWTAHRPHSWPAAAGDRLDRDFTPDDLLPQMRAAGIDGTVLMQSLNDLAETQEYLDLAHEHAFIRGVVGWIPLDTPAEAEAALARLSNRNKLVGIRHLLRFESARDWLDRADVLQSLALLAERGLVFELVPVNAEQYEGTLRIAERLPDLRLIVNHLGRPPAPEQGWEPWASFTARAAAHPNVAVKLSAGIALIAQWRWNTDQLRRYTDHVLACFGAQRVLAASNWPVILLAGDYQQVWRGITELLSDLSAADRAAVLGGTAERVYRLPSARTPAK